MTTPLTYDFGYSWWIGWGHLVPTALFGALAGLALWRRWPRWLVMTASLICLWSVAGLVISQFLFRLNLPVEPPSPRFLSSGAGRVVDIGAGSGRASIGLLLARPLVTVTAVDIYEGFYGIEDNTPDRLMRNARIAGVSDRIEAKVGDARDLPLDASAYDGVISVAAIDHLPRAGIPKALSEAARVLKPKGEFMLTIVNVDALARFTSPHALGHHPSADRNRWRELLAAAGFDLVEEGTIPGGVYFLGRKTR
jgi:SAM-dependent methyltransferase